MSEENPYAVSEAVTAPQVALDEPVELRPSPARRGIGAGFSWMAAGLEDFRRGPWAYVGFVVLVFVAGIALSSLSNIGFLIDPSIGFVVNMGASLALNLALFVLVGGFVLTVHESRRIGMVRFESFLAGFRHPRLGALLGLGGLYLALTLTIVVSAAVAVFATMGPTLTAVLASPMALDPSGWLTEDMILTLVIAFFVTGAFIAVVLGMFFFFSGHLVVLGDVGVFEAMKLSLIACLKNILPLFLWALIAFTLTLAGSLLCGLGLLVAMPVVWASTYQAFLEIFTYDVADRLSDAAGQPPTF